MPNGISCAYFAARNFIYGTKENNLFKEGIAAAQTIRTADAACNASRIVEDAANAANAVNASAAAAANVSPIAKFLSKGAAIARKILYPLIIASGVYNTVKSDDKVRTGVSQAAGIATMCAFENTLAYVQKKAIPKLVEKYGSKVPKNIAKIASKGLNFLNTNKYGKIAKYILQGILFATVSMGGYNTGSKIAEKIVDKHRSSKNKKDVALLEKKLSELGQSKVFEDMKL